MSDDLDFGFGRFKAPNATGVLGDVELALADDRRAEHDASEFLFHLDRAGLCIDAKKRRAVFDVVDPLANTHRRRTADGPLGDLPQKFLFRDIPGGVSIDGKDGPEHGPVRLVLFSVSHVDNAVFDKRCDVHPSGRCLVLPDHLAGPGLQRVNRSVGGS